LPTPEQHREKAEHDEFFIAHLGEPFWDWAITGLFYSALHYVEVHLARQTPPIHPETHRIRDSHVNRLMGGIYVDYRELEEQSRDARYDAAQQFTQQDFVRLQGHLARIKAAV
jgi:hypothetical protein